jgi:hypothetical protein
MAQKMKLPRPYIPLTRRALAARRQLRDRFGVQFPRAKGQSMSAYLNDLLTMLFKDEPFELDHDPALENRQFNPETGKYTPDANNPAFLVYRLKPAHLEKTTGRKPGASKTVTSKGSDNWIAKKFRKLEGPQRPKAKIPSRPFPRRKP